MFLLVCGRHVGANADGHQGGVSIQSNLRQIKGIESFIATLLDSIGLLNKELRKP